MVHTRLRSKSAMQCCLMAGVALLCADIAVAEDPMRRGVAIDLPGDLPVLHQSTLDPNAVFDALVDRYQHLSVYADTSRVVQTTERDGASSQTLDTRVNCTIDNGQLAVKTPRSQAWGLGRLGSSFRSTPMLEELRQGYALWLAPHMSLRFREEPLKDFRDGIRSGFEATKATRVVVQDRELVQLDLESCPSEAIDEGDTSGEECASFSLYVNPDSMLVERIEGEEALADGGTMTTTIDITPHMAAGLPDSASGDESGSDEQDIDESELMVEEPEGPKVDPRLGRHASGR